MRQRLICEVVRVLTDSIIQKSSWKLIVNANFIHFYALRSKKRHKTLHILRTDIRIYLPILEQLLIRQEAFFTTSFKRDNGFLQSTFKINTELPTNTQVH